MWVVIVLADTEEEEEEQEEEFFRHHVISIYIILKEVWMKKNKNVMNIVHMIPRLGIACLPSGHMITKI